MEGRCRTDPLGPRRRGVERQLAREAEAHGAYGCVRDAVVRRQEIHVAFHVVLDGFGSERRAQLAEALHGLLAAVLRLEVEHRWLARAVEQVRHQHRVALAGDALCHLLLRIADPEDVGQEHDARVATAVWTEHQPAARAVRCRDFQSALLSSSAPLKQGHPASSHSTRDDPPRGQGPFQCGRAQATKEPSRRKRS